MIFAGRPELFDFHVRVPGKWVLAGEHSVLKGATAVALPHPEFALSLGFKVRGVNFGEIRKNGALSATQTYPSREKAEKHPSDFSTFLEVIPADAQPVIRELIGQIIRLAGHPSTVDAGARSFLDGSSLPIAGQLSIQSTIPVGAGLGSSAALCVAVTRWLAGPLQIPQNEWAATATQLEHHFHGKSSGMDVAVICAEKPVAFSMQDGAKPLTLQRLPRFTFHDTGLRASTKECIQKVEAFRAQNASATQIDEQMKHASQAALAGLTLYDQGDRAQGLALVAQAMTQGQSCFETWGLMPAQAQSLKTQLLEQGARAVKLTGAGGGGMLVALWE